MTRQDGMKVFGWTGMKPPKFELPGHEPRNNSPQVRVIVAANSRAAAVRAAGENPRSAFVRDFVGETGNVVELAVARAKPGAVFMAPLDGPHRREFVEVPEEFLR